MKEVHFDSLNKALDKIDPKFVISMKEHIEIYDGLSTNSKIDLLVKHKDFPIDQKQNVFELKQSLTIESINELLEPRENVVGLIKHFYGRYKLCITSNAIRNTLDVGLKKLGIHEYFDKIYSNQDITYHKPNPEIYLRCMADFGVSPSQTIIVEDSKNGRESAVKSSAHVYGVDSPQDLNIDRLEQMIKENDKNRNVKWAGKANVNIVIPMSGAGSRFAKAGYSIPKPLIPVNGKPMISIVVNNLNIDAVYTYIVQEEHYNKYNLQYFLKMLTPNCNIITVNGVTEGAACSVLLAKEIINNDKHLLIANSDQYIDWDSCDFMYNMLSLNADGGILTFNSNDPKWSFIKTDKDNNITEVVEKQVVSDLATVGIYYYNKGSDFVSAAETMIDRDLRVNNEFYVAPTYNIMIENKAKIIPYKVDKMFGLGTPEDLDFFLQNVK